MNLLLQPIAQADLLLLLADFWRAPEQTAGTFDELSEDDLHSLIESTGLPDRQRLLSQLLTTWRVQQSTSLSERAAVYRALFDGKIACPINEATFIRRDKGAIIGDLCGFYRAFGWEHCSHGERADHLLVELEFVAMLLVMSARAASAEQRETTIAALAEFTRQHPNDWLTLFCQQIRESTTYPYFLEASHLLESVWNALIQFHDWTVDMITTNPVGFCDEPENPYECGAPDLVQLDTSVAK